MVPQEFLEELLTRLEQNRQTMHDLEQNVKRGNFSNEWVDDALTKLDCFRPDTRWFDTSDLALPLARSLFGVDKY